MNRKPHARRRAAAHQHAPMASAFSWWIPLVATALAVPIAWWLEVTRPLNLSDDAWFLQIATRVAQGDVLYRDVYAPVTPLSVWITAAAVKTFGSTIDVLNAVNLVAWATTLLLGLTIIRLLKVHWLSIIPYTAAMLALNPPGASGPGSAYNPIAQVFMVGTMLLCLQWLQAKEQSRTRLLLAVAGGVLAGLTFATKQNLGVLTYCGLIGSTALVSAWNRRWTEAAQSFVSATVAATAIVAVAFAVVTLQHGLQELIRYGFQALGTYSDESVVLYRTGIFTFLGNFTTPITSASTLQSIALLVFFLPYFAIGLPLLAWVRDRRVDAYTLTLWGAVGLFAAYPRWDICHLQIGTPLLLASIAGATHMLARSSRTRRLAWLIATVIAVGCLGVMIALKGIQVTDGSIQRIDVPHFRGAYLRYDSQPAWDIRPTVASTRVLRRVGQDKSVVILGYRSGFLYLATGIKNPTAYDYATGGIIGPREGWEILELYKDGKVDAVWVDRSNQIPGFPGTKFADWLAREWEPTMRTAYGTLYEPSEKWESLRTGN